MTTAFQPDAFQVNAFQIDEETPIYGKMEKKPSPSAKEEAARKLGEFLRGISPEQKRRIRALFRPAPVSVPVEEPAEEEVRLDYRDIFLRRPPEVGFQLLKTVDEWFKREGKTVDSVADEWYKLRWQEQLQQEEMMALVIMLAEA